MLESFTVKGLNGNNRTDYYSFNTDLNVITGMNGAGKTTFIKLLWYLLSGNISSAISDITFESAILETNEFIIEIFENPEHKPKKISNKQILVGDIHIQTDHTGYDAKITNKISRENILNTLESKNTDIRKVESLISKLTGDSIFFPTFRRIEGGFTTKYSNKGFDYSFIDSGERIEQSLKRLSDSLTKEKHLFITSVSTIDIVDLLTKEYAEVSEEVNRRYIQFSRDIEQRISSRHTSNWSQSDKNLLLEANYILEDIQSKIKQTSEHREELFRPFTILNNLVSKIFQHKGIKVTESLTLGKTKEAMVSDSLSAGEKQMLSFICYNSFYKNSVIFIDEPEISLHVDWQRILMSTLLSQKSNNQFIVATHSPFIYSKYVDKEIMLNEDRGGF